MEARVHLAIDVAVGTGAAARSVVFTDADGTAATIRVAGGAAVLTFDAPDVAQSTVNGVATVTGTNVQWTNVVITGTNPGVTVTTNAGGNRVVTLGGIQAAGPVRGFSGRGVILSGTSVLNNGIGRLELNTTQGATLTINRSGQARLQDASIAITTATDTSITSHQPFRHFRVGVWGTGIPGQPDQVTTPRINVLQSNGNWNADVTINGAGQAVGRPVLGNARMLGSLESGTWNVVGRASRLAVDSVGANWQGTFGDVASFAVANDLAGDVTASSINALMANTITGSRIQLTGPSTGRAAALNRLAARGAITGADIRSNGNIGTVSASVISGSTIFAGVSGGGDALPTSAASFASQSTIRNVTIRNRQAPRVATPAFINSNIAASTLGRMNLGLVQVSNGGDPFGLAAQTIQSVSAVGASNLPIRDVQLTEPADSFEQADFKVRVF